MSTTPSRPFTVLARPPRRTGVRTERLSVEALSKLLEVVATLESSEDERGLGLDADRETGFDEDVPTVIIPKAT